LSKELGSLTKSQGSLILHGNVHKGNVQNGRLPLLIYVPVGGRVLGLGLHANVRLHRGLVGHRHMHRRMRGGGVEPGSRPVLRKDVSSNPVLHMAIGSMSSRVVEDRYLRLLDMVGRWHLDRSVQCLGCLGCPVGRRGSLALCILNRSARKPHASEVGGILGSRIILRHILLPKQVCVGTQLWLCLSWGIDFGVGGALTKKFLPPVFLAWSIDILLNEQVCVGNWLWLCLSYDISFVVGGAFAEKFPHPLILILPAAAKSDEKIMAKCGFGRMRGFGGRGRGRESETVGGSGSGSGRTCGSRSAIYVLLKYFIELLDSIAKDVCRDFGRHCCRKEREECDKEGG